MDHLWTPWRTEYIAAKRVPGCIFCAAVNSDNDEETLLVHRAQHSFVILNRYPYTSGHLMIAPYAHASRLGELPLAVTAEIMNLARVAETSLENAYEPHGLNFGLNLGEAAGAGIEQHLHLHALPRWKGDANFMTSVGNARIIPETLDVTYRKLKAEFGRALANVNL